MRKIEFIKEFATKKKGSKGIYDNQVASNLVRVKKVAKYADKIGETDKLLNKETKAKLDKKAAAYVMATLEDTYLKEAKEMLMAKLKDAENSEIRESVFLKLKEEFEPKEKK